mmetsp:Transcript_69328/g.225892  ORF Transcript_69328/g.225892 Transcript_69328/m.225892 type:complete len:274 (-) Transcript_69328:1165-1986(-)
MRLYTIHHCTNPHQGGIFANHSILSKVGTLCWGKIEDLLILGLQLQSQVQGVEAAEGDVSALEPQARLSRRLPHIPQLALPRPLVSSNATAQTPARADGLRNLRRDQPLDQLRHVLVARRQHQDVAWQLMPVVQDDRSRLHLGDGSAALQLNFAIGDQLRGADIEVIATKGPQEHHVESGLVLAKRLPPASIVQLRVELRVVYFDPFDPCLAVRDAQAIGRRSASEVASCNRHSLFPRLLRVASGCGKLPHAARLDHTTWGPLQHRDLGAVLP